MHAKEEIQGIITELYSIISGPAGHKPNWKREAELYLPSATMLRTTVDAEGHPHATIMAAADYLENFEKAIAGRAFYEVEVHNIIEIFGNIAHAFSTYEAWGDSDKTIFLKRGINSIQFFFDGSNWKVVSMIWDDERDGLSVERKYLGGNIKAL
jgi:hypothetical protein